MSEANQTVAEMPSAGVYPRLTPKDIRHNMFVIVALDSIFTIGVADLNMATTPLWVHLGATDAQIGFINSLTILSLIGILLSPFISVRFTYKKWYLFLIHLPYIGSWGAMGVVTAFSGHWGLSFAWLLTSLTVLNGMNFLSGGFVSLPHQEYISACIPMSHRARFSGFSMAFGSLFSLGAIWLGGYILAKYEKPMAFGYLYLMTWFFCQGGYVMALFGRERPTPVEKAPTPWSLNMLKAVWRDPSFIRLISVHAAYVILLMPMITTFVTAFGFRDLGMASEKAAIIVGIISVVRIFASGFIGYFTDKLGPVRVLPWWTLIGAAAILVPVAMPSEWGVYVSAAFGALFSVGTGAAFLALIFGLPTPENRAGHYTIQLIENTVAGSLGPLCAGWACTTFGYMPMFVGCGIMALALYPITRLALKDISANPEDYS